MYQIDFQKPLAVHFIGIGGISMSGLAEVLLEEGFSISGSDAKESPLTRTLEEKGAKIFYGQRASNITDSVQAVVYTAAIHPDNPEFKRAKELNLPMLTRAQLLGQIMRNYDMPVAVAGTHGKTTTTSMLSHVLLKGDCDHYHQRRRNPSCNRRQYPCRQVRNLPYRSLRIYQQLFKLFPKNQHYPEY